MSPGDAPVVAIEIQNVPLHVVGAGILVLGQSYDPDQHWLPFVQAVFPQANPPKPVTIPTREQSARRIRHKLKAPARCPPGSRSFGMGLVLPFVEARRISQSEMQQHQKAYFPGWDRDRNGSIFVLAVGRADREELREWLHENCVGRYHAAGNFAYVQSADDAATLKLVYHGGGRGKFVPFNLMSRVA